MNHDPKLLDCFKSLDEATGKLLKAQVELKRLTQVYFAAKDLLDDSSPKNFERLAKAVEKVKAR